MRSKSRPLQTGWFVVSDRSLVISGPYLSEETVRAAANGHAAQLRQGMRASGRFDEEQIQERAAALRIAYGARIGDDGAVLTVLDAKRCTATSPTTGERCWLPARDWAHRHGHEPLWRPNAQRNRWPVEAATPAAE